MGGLPAEFSVAVNVPILPTLWHPLLLSQLWCCSDCFLSHFLRSVMKGPRGHPASLGLRTHRLGSMHSASSITQTRKQLRVPSLPIYIGLLLIDET